MMRLWKHKEEGDKKRIFDTDDRNRVYKELMKHSHSLKTTHSNQMANASVNVQEALKIDESMFLDFRSSLPDGFHDPIKLKLTTMESIKCGVAIGGKTLCGNWHHYFSRLITVGQHRQVEHQSL